MCDMDIDIEYGMDIESDPGENYELETVEFESLESADDIDYEILDTVETPEYSIDIFTDAAFEDIVMEEDFSEISEADAEDFREVISESEKEDFSQMIDEGREKNFDEVIDEFEYEFENGAIEEADTEINTELFEETDTDIEADFIGDFGVEEYSENAIDFLSEIPEESIGEELAEVEAGMQLEQFCLEEMPEEILETETEVEPEIVISPEEAAELVDSGDNVVYLEHLRDALQSGSIAVETDEDIDGEDPPKVLTRELTPEILENREHNTNEILDNYRDNLRDYGVNEEKIEEYISQEREKINAEYESLDQGDLSSNIYYQPENWAEVAASLEDQESNSEYQEVEIIEPEHITDVKEPESEQLNSEIQEQNIDYNEIYEEIEQDALEQGFENIQIDEDSERLDSSLKDFDESIWENLSLQEQKNTMAGLADYVVDVIGFDNPPLIEYYNNPREGDFGGYDPATNSLHINEYMLYNSDEAADTIAHELWHAHQHECAMHPRNARDYQYQYNFENYIPPALGQEAYEAQLVEAEARAFAAQFKDRLDAIKGRSR